LKAGAISNWHQDQKFREELAAKEAKRRERDEAHLYLHARVVTEGTFQHHGGMDLAGFEASPETDPSAPRHYRVLKATKMEDMVARIASDMGTDPKLVRLWVMVNRQNKTVRPDQPIMDVSHTIDETWIKTGNAHREAVFKLWAETAEEVDASGNALWPTYAPTPTGAVKTDIILLFLKCFDSEAQELRGVGHVYIAKDKKVEDLVPMILKKMGWGEKLPPDDKILLWEEIKPTMVEALKAKTTLKGAELQDGDIVCFQRVTDRKSEKSPEKKLAALENGKRLVDRFDDAKEYYDFLHHKKMVRFRPHPSKCTDAQYSEFELTMSSKMVYDGLAERVGNYLGVPQTHIRFWTVNSASGNPKMAVKRIANNNLAFILNPTGYQQSTNAQRPDAFFYEVLDMSLAELDLKKSIKVTWLSEGISKEDVYDILVNKNGRIEDLIEALVVKARIPGEDEAGPIRVYESTNNRFFRELARDHPIINMNEYTSVYAERVPEEELDADENHFIAAFHFQSEPSRMHSVPFKFLLKEVCFSIHGGQVTAS
jgi:ubiquitin carboxyl-terminal hydrolase 7